MKKIIFALLISSGLLNGEIYKEETERLELILQQIPSRTDVWPTLDWDSFPLIVTFESGHIFAFHLKSTHPSQTIHLNGSDIQFFTQDYWGLSNIHMQTVFNIEGQEAFVYKMQVTDSAVQDAALLAHERFHRHQSEQFMMKEPPGASLDHLSEENLTWSEMEDDLLRQFLSAPELEKLEILKDFAAVHGMRRSAIEPVTRQWENHQFRMEGLADYVSSRIYGQEPLLLSMHPEEEDRDDFIDQVIKWRHYMAGASLGYALDFLQVKGWKESVEQGEMLADILSKALAMPTKERNKRIKRIQEKLGYKKRRKIAEGKVSRHLKKVEDLTAQYEQKAGIKLFLGHPRLLISGGGVNDEMVYVNDASIVALNDASTATTRDGKWKFETKNISHLFQHPRGLREVKVDRLARIQVNHQELIYENSYPMEYPFQSLKIACDEVLLDSRQHAGVLIMDPEGLHVRYL